MNERSTDLCCPPEILDWIPWYAEDALAESQRGAVEAHAAQCEECRKELAMLSGGPVPPMALPDPEPVFARVLARIEAGGMGEAPIRVGSPLAPARARRAPLLRETRGDGRHSLSRIAAVAVLVLSVGAAGWFASSAMSPGGDSVYRTASAPEVTPLVGNGGVQLDVVFRSDAGIERINTDLRALGAVVVGGPSQAGRYRVTLPEGSDASAAAAMLRAEGRGVASFAEPLRP
jgi:hypothetical protein